jgi:S1-C subfamily serine protease
MRRYSFFLVCFLAISFIPAKAHGQIVVDLTNKRGISAPCIGIGPAAPVALKCAKICEEAGFLRNGDVGYSGLTVATDGAEDGKVTEVAAGSPAAQAGIVAGDAIVAVNGTRVKPTPGTIARWKLFGAKGEDIRLKTKRGESVTELKITRAQAPRPPDVPKGNLLLQIRPDIDYEGQIVPCMGAGPLGPIALSACDSKFKKFGFIKVSDLGTTGIAVDVIATDKAIISAVDAGSAAATAGVQVGDEILEIEGKPLTWSLGEATKEALFAKVGTTLKLTVLSNGAEKAVDLTLIANPKK